MRSAATPRGPRPARKAEGRLRVAGGRLRPASTARNGNSKERPGWRRARDGHDLAAGRVLGVGLVCFALWLFFDARQLDANANASPPGTRRSVALALLAPIARVEEFFGADRIVDGANRTLGRASSSSTPPPVVALKHPTHSTHPAPQPTVPTPAAPAVVPGTGVDLKPPSGPLAPRSSSSGAPSVPSTTTPVSSRTATAPPLVQPTPAQPLRVLEIGDSLGVDLGYGLTDVLGNDPRIRLQTKAVIDTGLANVAYYNWPAVLEKDLRSFHPGLVIAMVGGNDTQNFFTNGRVASFGTPFWRVAYRERVLTVMREATAAGARVVWVGMPQMAPGAPISSEQMAILNSVYSAQAAKVPGVLYVPTWHLLANSAGRYTTFLPSASGSLVAVREPDGVHLDYPAGDDLVAHAIVSAVRAHWKVQL